MTQAAGTGWPGARAAPPRGASSSRSRSRRCARSRAGCIRPRSPKTVSGRRCRCWQTASKALLPVDLDVPLARFDPELEACAYYLVAEALANASKYAEASRATVRVVARVDAIEIDVADDGCGGAWATPGGGLEGLAERVSALGGALDVVSPPDEGTRLHAELPVPLHVS